MGEAKSLEIRPVRGRDAARVIRALHYSGTSNSNSQIHLGVFYRGKCGGALQFGPPIDRRKVLPLVTGTPWGGMIELNRMALADWLPRNGESRALGVALRLLRRHFPIIKWVLSYADATQCGDGTIYRAAGFVLTGINRNRTLLRLPSGQVIANKTLKDFHAPDGRDGESVARAAGARPLPGFQLRYIYFLDASWRARLAVPALDHAAIARAGARMVRGRSLAAEA